MISMEEFLQPKSEPPKSEPPVEAAKPAEVSAAAEPTAAVEPPSSEATAETPAVAEDNSVELDVQKAVVESLAADKAAQDEEIDKLRKASYQLKLQIGSLEEKIANQREALEKVGDVLAANTESKLSNQVSVLERNLELEDRYEGETRDHLLEVIKEARDQAEADGRLRRAQILEAVLISNEPTGSLEQKRNELKKLFNDNINILSGPVIEELKKRGISHKHGEEYLLPSEIVKRNY